MRVLVVSQWYPPEPMPLLSDLATTLARSGHDVRVLTGFPNWPTGLIYPGYTLRVVQHEILDGIPLTRLPLYPDHSHSATKRIANFLSFACSAALLGPFVTRRADVIHVIHPPITVALAGWFLSRLWRVPFTLEIQDMWPETLAATGMVRNKTILASVARFSGWVYRRAAAIRVISPGFRDNLTGKGVPPDKIHVISNWVDTEFYRPVGLDVEFGRTLGLSADRFNVMFAGTIGLAQNLQTLLEAAGLLRDLPNVHFVLVGDGLDLPHLRKLAKDRRLENVTFLGRRPPEDMARIYSFAAGLLLHLRDDPLFRITIPHKLFAYMAVGKPVLAAVLGDVADIVQRQRAGLTCLPSDPNGMAAMVRRLYGMTTADRDALGRNGREAAQREYGRETLVGRLEAMLAAVVKGVGAE